MEILHFKVIQIEQVHPEKATLVVVCPNLPPSSHPESILRASFGSEFE